MAYATEANEPLSLEEQFAKLVIRVGELEEKATYTDSARFVFQFKHVATSSTLTVVAYDIKEARRLASNDDIRWLNADYNLIPMTTSRVIAIDKRGDMSNPWARYQAYDMVK